MAEKTLDISAGTNLRTETRDGVIRIGFAEEWLPSNTIAALFGFDTNTAGDGGTVDNRISGEGDATTHGSVQIPDNDWLGTKPALDLDGVEDYLDMVLSQVDNYTLFIWVCPRDLDATSTDSLLTTEFGSDNDAIFLEQVEQVGASDNDARLFHKGDGGSIDEIRTNDTRMTNQAWNALLAGRAGSGASSLLLRVDDVDASDVVSTDEGAGQNTDTDWTIGAFDNNGISRYYDGKIAAVIVVAGTTTASEKSDLALGIGDGTLNGNWTSAEIDESAGDEDWQEIEIEATIPGTHTGATVYYETSDDNFATSPKDSASTTLSDGTDTLDTSNVTQGATARVRIEPTHDADSQDLATAEVSSIKLSDTTTAFGVSTLAASNVGETKATLEGELTGLGGASSADVFFEYRKQGATTWQTTPTQTFNSAQTFSETVQPLERNVTYEYRAVADGSDGSSDTGATVTFSTVGAEAGERLLSLESVSYTLAQGEAEGDLSFGKIDGASTQPIQTAQEERDTRASIGREPSAPTQDSPDDRSPSSPGSWSVQILSATSPVAEGGLVEVEARVRNRSPVDGSTSVTLDAQSTEQDSTTVNLDSREETTVILEWQTVDGDGGTGETEYDVTIAAGDESDTATVTVLETVAGVKYRIDILGTNSPVKDTDTLEVDARIINVGVNNGSQQTISLDILNAAGDTEEYADVDTTDETLDSLEWVERTYEWDVPTGAIGEYTARVESSDDEDTTSVNVEEDVGAIREYQVEILSATDPATVGKQGSAETEITSTYTEAESKEVTASLGGEKRGDEVVDLEPGETKTVDIPFTPREGDETGVGATTLKVASPGDEDNTQIQVDPAETTDGQLDILTFTVRRSRVVVGNVVPFEAEVENNTGSDITNATTRFEVDGTSVVKTQTVTVPDGDTQTILIEWNTVEGDEGTYTATFFTDKESQTSGQFEVVEETENDVNYDITNTAVTQTPTCTDAYQVEVDVKNTGSDTDRLPIELFVDGTLVDSEDRTIDSNTEETDIPLSWTPDETDGEDGGTHTVEVSTPHDTQSLSDITVPGNCDYEDGDFTVDILENETDTSVTIGNTATIKATIGNDTGSSETGRVGLKRDGEKLPSTFRDVSLNNGATTDETFSWTPSDEYKGDTVEVCVISGTKEDCIDIEVQEKDGDEDEIIKPPKGDFDVEVTERDSPVEQGTGASVSVKLTNNLDEPQSGTVVLDGSSAPAGAVEPGRVSSFSFTTIPAGESRTYTDALTWNVPGDAETGSYDFDVYAARGAAGSTTIEVQYGDAYFVVTDISTPSEVGVGSASFDADVTVENKGGSGTLDFVAVGYDPSGVCPASDLIQSDGFGSLSFNAGETKTITDEVVGLVATTWEDEGFTTDDSVPAIARYVDSTTGRVSESRSCVSLSEVDCTIPGLSSGDSTTSCMPIEEGDRVTFTVDVGSDTGGVLAIEFNDGSNDSNETEINFHLGNEITAKVEGFAERTLSGGDPAGQSFNVTIEWRSNGDTYISCGGAKTFGSQRTAQKLRVISVFTNASISTSQIGVERDVV
jgi:hypothetical protein